MNIFKNPNNISYFNKNFRVLPHSLQIDNNDNTMLLDLVDSAQHIRVEIHPSASNIY
jgi:hypothetical protein